MKLLSLGAFLKHKREALNLSQEQVAAKLGYASVQYISEWEQGIRTPPLKNYDHISDIIKLYGLSPEEYIEKVLSEQRIRLHENLAHKTSGQSTEPNELEGFLSRFYQGVLNANIKDKDVNELVGFYYQKRADLFKFFRVYRNISINEMACLLNLKAEDVESLESGSGYMPPELILSFCQILSVTKEFIKLNEMVWLGKLNVSEL